MARLPRRRAPCPCPLAWAWACRPSCSSRRKGPPCFLEKDALSVLGIDNYLDLWVRFGKVVKKASALMQSEGHSTAARDQVRRASDQLNRAVYYRQLDVMTYRCLRRQQATSAEIQRGGLSKEDIKQDLLKTKQEGDILKQYDTDCDDHRTMIIELALGRSSPNACAQRRNELMSDCPHHKRQLDYCHQTMQELHALLKCKVWRREMALTLHGVPDILDVLVCVRCDQVH